jgi:hypothetical protein
LLNEDFASCYGEAAPFQFGLSSLRAAVGSQYRLLGIPDSGQSIMPSKIPPQVSMTLREPALCSSQVISAREIPSEAQMGIARRSISVA